MKPVDFGKTAVDYGKHRAGFPAELFAELKAYGIGLPGQRIVDLGTGTGTIARQLAAAGCKVIGLDISEPMLAQAKVLDSEAGVQVDYRMSPAEETGLPSGTFDVVIAGQCWHWFDRAKAAGEAWRLLRQGSPLIIAYFDWLPLASGTVEATEQLILKHSPQWKLSGGLGIHPHFLPQLSATGFQALRTFSFDLDVPYSHEAWRGRIRASAGIGPVLSPEAIQRFDDELREMLEERFPEEPLHTPHRVWAAMGYKA